MWLHTCKKRKSKKDFYEEICKGYPFCDNLEVIGHNLVKFNTQTETGFNCTVFRYHESDILFEFEDKTKLINPCFWSKATRKNLNKLLEPEYTITTKNYSWEISSKNKSSILFPYFKIDGNGSFAHIYERDEREEEYRKSFKLYSDKLISLEEAPFPTTGDCFSCMAGNSVCSYTHLEEKYVHGTLIFKAFKEMQGSESYAAYYLNKWNDRNKKYVLKTLNRYFRKHLELGYS